MIRQTGRDRRRCLEHNILAQKLVLRLFCALRSDVTEVGWLEVASSIRPKRASGTIPFTFRAGW
jgi:hypothetical protein